MNKKVVNKILVFILTLLIVFLCSYNIVYGSYEDFTGKTDPTGYQTAEYVINMILASVRLFAAGIAVIVITFLGGKYMMSAASEKAQIKSQLINFTIGVVVVVAATGIVQILIEFAGKLGSSTE